MPKVDTRIDSELADMVTRIDRIHALVGNQPDGWYLAAKLEIAREILAESRKLIRNFAAAREA